ncbi:MAG: hypothetical protein ACU84H_13280 [Gammaproteobacteria bacterium]
MQIRPIPKPPGRLFVGNLPEFGKNPVGCMSGWHRDYGDMMRLTLEVLTRTMFSTSVLDRIETKRLRPPAGILIRRINCDTRLQDYPLKAGSPAIKPLPFSEELR